MNILSRLVAHRGYSHRYPENTLLSLGKAIEHGAHYIEFDVQLGRDHVPVLIHDDQLARTAAIDQRVSDLSSEQLSKISVGEPARFGDSFRNETIPLLSDVAPLLSTHPGVTAFVEIKRASIRRFGVSETVMQVINSLKPVLNQCVFISFSRDALVQAKIMGAGRIGWVFEPWHETNEALAHELAPDYLFTDVACLPQNKDCFWPGPWQWVIYELNDLDAIEAWLHRGADLVETNAIGDLAGGIEVQPDDPA